MTAPQNPRVTQADREQASGFFSPGAPEQACLAGEFDDRPIVQAFARHREAAEAASKACEAALVEALAKARKIIRDVEDYMARPDRGDWGVECALCMGELFDDDQEAIAAIDAALTPKEPDA